MPGTQDFHGVELLHLLRGEERTNLRVELLQDRIRLRPRLLMDCFELRFHAVHVCLHLRLLRIRQVERMDEHAGQVMWPVMMMRRTRLVVWTLRAA